MNIVIASGKGGTGKTTVAVNLAYHLARTLPKQVALCDCDVEAPNDDLFIKANFSKIEDVTVVKPQWHSENCTLCGKCVSDCHYNAIAKVKKNILIFDELCHSCGACFELCPEKAFTLNTTSIGQVKSAKISNNFSFIQGELNIGESLAPEIIKHLKKDLNQDSINILDASPGTTCPVVTTLENADFCIFVTEATPFGLHDLKLAASICQQLAIPSAIVINRSTRDDTLIEEFSNQAKIPIISKIPFDKKYAYSYSVGDILVEKFPELEIIFSKLYQKLFLEASIPNLKAQSDHIIQRRTSNISDNFNNEVKDIVVLSGKGGTGKTTISAALSRWMPNKVIADLDVDASNLYLVTNPSIESCGEFIGGQKYQIDQSLCTKCGLCFDKCYFDAISFDQQQYRVKDQDCEGCGLCAALCPSDAISARDNVTGLWFESKTEFGKFSHAKLGVGEENSGKLVTLVRNNAKKFAVSQNSSYILNDGPPGTGCPVIASVTGCDLAIIVTEPTMSAIHDLKKILKLVKYFQVPCTVIINKYDLNPSLSIHLESELHAMSISVIGKVSFDFAVQQALMTGGNVLDNKDCSVANEIINCFKNIKEIL